MSEAWRSSGLDGVIGIVLSGGGARGAHEFGALESDQLAHDVDTLATINDDVKQSRNPIKHRLVPHIFVAAADRLALGRLAMDVYNRCYAGARGLRRNRELALLGQVLDVGVIPSAATC